MMEQPVVSTANVGQLAVDLLIATVGLQRIGVFHPQYFIPVVGQREGNREGITTPCERKFQSLHPRRYLWFGKYTATLIMISFWYNKDLPS